jgi:hypothetical protein
MTMISIQKELEDVKEARQREARQGKEDREELSILRDRCHKLEEENELRLQSVRMVLFTLDDFADSI